MNPSEAARVKLLPAVRLLMTTDTLDTAAMLPDAICSTSEDIETFMRVKLMFAGWLTATPMLSCVVPVKKPTGKAKVMALDADNVPPMVVVNEIVAEMLACCGNRNALLSKTRTLVTEPPIAKRGTLNMSSVNPALSVLIVKKLLVAATG